MNNHADRSGRRTMAMMIACSALMALGGCRGGRDDNTPRQFFPDLDDQMKWKPQGESDFFADGRMMRKPVSSRSNATFPTRPWSVTVVTS